jgi:hypothetical protein
MTAVVARTTNSLDLVTDMGSRLAALSHRRNLIATLLFLVCTVCLAFVAFAIYDQRVHDKGAYEGRMGAIRRTISLAGKRLQMHCLVIATIPLITLP